MNDEEIKNQLEKNARKWAWGLAEACNAALDNKAKADAETFLAAIKKIQEETLMLVRPTVEGMR